MEESFEFHPPAERDAPAGHQAEAFDGKGLTLCERATVELAAGGLSNSEIARVRGVALSTLTKQLSSAYKKLGVASRRELRATWPLTRPRRPGGYPDTHALSERERQVLTFAAGGYANKVIAMNVGVCLSTVSTLLTRARRKIRARAASSPTKPSCLP
jgi:DNA-binding NarL/FixJ family response regulator